MALVLHYISKEDQIVDRVIAYNKLVNVVNELVEELIPLVRNAKFSVDNRSLYSKDQKLIDQVFDKYRTRDLRLYLDITEYAVWLKADICYRVDDFGTCYLDLDTYLTSRKDKAIRTQKKYKTITVDGYKMLLAGIARCDEDITKLNNHKNELIKPYSRLLQR